MPRRFIPPALMRRDPAATGVSTARHAVSVTRTGDIADTILHKGAAHISSTEGANNLPQNSALLTNRKGSMEILFEHLGSFVDGSVTKSAREHGVAATPSG
jgi:hypothetical protein